MNEDRSIEIAEKEIAPIEKWAATITIHNNDEYVAVAEELKRVKGIRATVTALFADSKSAAHAAWKAIVALEKKFTDRLDIVEVAAKKALIVWQQEQDRLAAEEQARLNAKAKAEEDRRRSALLAKAEKADAKGSDGAAEEFRQQAADVAVAPPVVVHQVEAVKGISMRKVWKAAVLDKAAVPEEYKIVDVAALNKVANATKGQIKIAGVRFNEESVVAAGRTER